MTSAGMTDKYDPVPDVVSLIISALYGRHDVTYWAEKVAGGCGFDDEASPETVARVLREALGMPAASRTCKAVSAVDGTVCGQPAERRAGRCEHGHLREGWLCDDCRAREDLWCQVCYRLPAPDGHKCPVALFPAEAVTRAVTPGQEAGNAEG